MCQPQGHVTLWIKVVLRPMFRVWMLETAACRRSVEWDGLRETVAQIALELNIFILVHAELPWEVNGELLFPLFMGRKIHDQCYRTLLFFFC